MSREKRRFHRPDLSRSALLFGVVLVGLILSRFVRLDSVGSQFTFDSPELYFVERVVDGDTLKLAGGERVRLIGVDTPETKHPTKPVEPLGPEAAAFTRKHVEKRHVRLQFDRERRDQFGRILAFVFAEDFFLNEELIRAGYSKAETRFPYNGAMKRRFRAAEEAARREQRGLWGDKATSDRGR
jgi:micrococcal nuclease